MVMGHIAKSASCCFFKANNHHATATLLFLVMQKSQVVFGAYLSDFFLALFCSIGFSETQKSDRKTFNGILFFEFFRFD